MSINDKRIVRSVTKFTVFVLLMLCFGLLCGCSDNTVEPSADIPTPTQLLYGLSYKTSVKYDSEKVKASILSDPRFLGFDVRDEYTMVYLINSKEDEARYKEFLGISDVLPEVDYSENNLLLSVGRKIKDIVDKKRTDDDGNKLITFEYDEDYHKDTVFVYRERKIDFVSGLSLEQHFLETFSTDCNLTEGDRTQTELVAQGEFFKIYSKGEGLYEYVLMLKEEQKMVIRRFTENLPEIIEHSETMVQVIDGEEQMFFNPVTNASTDKTNQKLFFLKNNLVAYARLYNGDIILCIRDAYEPGKYNYAYDVPFTQDKTIKNELLVSIEYVDRFNVFVEFYGGADKTLQNMTVKVVDMEYK